MQGLLTSIPGSASGSSSNTPIAPWGWTGAVGLKPEPPLLWTQQFWERPEEGLWAVGGGVPGALTHLCARP